MLRRLSLAITFLRRCAFLDFVVVYNSRPVQSVSSIKEFIRQDRSVKVVISIGPSNILTHLLLGTGGGNRDYKVTCILFCLGDMCARLVEAQETRKESLERPRY